MKKIKLCFKVFVACLYLSCFTYGGGYVIVPLMRRRFVEDKKWLGEEEMMDIVSIAQSSPGAIAINTALLSGYRIAGIPGAFFALLGTVLPSLVIVCIVSVLYNFIRDNQVVAAVLLGMQAGVAALICDISFTVSSGVAKQKNIFLILLMITAFVLIFFIKVNVAYIILACIFLGVLFTIVRQKFMSERDKNPTALIANPTEPCENPTRESEDQL